MKTIGLAMKAAFPHTIPILTGFLFLGIAFGVLMQVNHLGLGWAMMLSMVTFAGSMQFVAVTLLTAAFDPLYAFLLTLMVNARHLFYGVSMLEKFRGTGKKKPFLIFSLCDETFSVLCSAKAPEGIHSTWFMFFIALFDYLYWALGTLLGGLLGQIITFNTEGLDFVLTALFVVIFLNQWKSLDHHIVPIAALFCSIVSLCVFGPDLFLLPAMVSIIIVLFLLQKYYEKKGDHLI